MPLYEYQCSRCGRFEIIQSFSAPPLGACPTCGSEVQKLLSAPAIHFKGTGWYVTDYARKGDGSAAASAPSASKDTASKDSSSGGSTPAAAKDGSTSGGSPTK